MSYQRGDLFLGMPSSSTSTPSTLSLGGLGLDEGLGDMSPDVSVAQGKTKLYRIVDGAVAENWCLGMIGSGGHTFCINKEYQVKHRGGVKFNFEPTHLYVLKEPGVAFVSPSVESSLLNARLHAVWIITTKSWSEVSQAVWNGSKYGW